MKNYFLMIGLTLSTAAYTQQQPVVESPQSPPAKKLSSVTHDQAAEALKQALVKGVESAIRELGHDGGFLTNLNVKIPMPKELQTIEKAARALKEEKLADEFVETMNHAAERAVPEAASVFSTAISRMTLADAESILTGSPDAATQYFRRTTETNLFEKFLPIVKKATDATGVTSSYKKLLHAANQNKFLGGLLGKVSDPQSLDVDAYVTQKALDGLFKEVAIEERRIRESASARTTDLLRKVFGAVAK